MNPPIDRPPKTRMIMRWRSLAAAAAAAAAVLLAASGLLKSLPNSCVMTYMYPTYVPVPHPAASTKYGLFLYHEGWKPIDFVQHLRGISGVPVLFIPGNGGSYKQVRSLGAESDRAFNAGPTEETYYRESTFTPEEAGMNTEKSWWRRDEDLVHARDLLEDDDIPGTYVNRLDWFAVDLEGEHSALDGRILEEHTEYVVQAIHRILDQYKESLEVRSGSKKANEEELPKSVILVGHSMGGFVARAAVVHPNLRKGSVETVITISSPHLLAPLALQPSLGHFFSRVNSLWRLGYERTRPTAEPLLGNVVVISIPGGIHDYQVRSRMASLDGIVPATHSLTVGSPGMLNAWLSTEHQTILWCNQLVVQLSHTLLKLVDKNTGQALTSPRKRLAVFIASLRSALPQTLGWLPTADAAFSKETGSSQALKNDKFACPKDIRWDNRERDLKVDTSSVTVLAMDGRRRWLDIKKQASHGKTSFVLVTNLSPCIGIRVHLWPEKSRESTELNPVEVTTRMVQLPATPAPRQAEPGGKSEQAPPSGVLKLGPADLKGFQYLMISVAPRPTVTGRPPQAASMAVGQFFDTAEGSTSLSPWRFLYSLFRKQNILLEENHPLVVDVSVSIGFGVLPLDVEIQTASCGIADTTLYRQETGDSEAASLCKLRCFPPIALHWDPYTGLQVVPNLRSQTIISDSSAVVPGLKQGSQDPALTLLVDPHCGYNITFKVAKSATFHRFVLTQAPQIGGFLVAVLLFALMRQARAWELDQPFPSVHACLEGNLIFPVPFIPLCVGPLILYFAYVSLGGDVAPPYAVSTVVAVVCYLFASGTMTLLAVSSTLVFHTTASLQLFIQSRWHSWRSRRSHPAFQRVLAQLSACFSFEMIKRMRAMPRLTVGVMATVLTFFVHPALGLALVLLSHTCSCHFSLCSYRYREVSHKAQEDEIDKTSRSSHLESFKFFQALLLLHFTATAMLLPSFIAWIQRPKVDQTLPWLLDSLLSFGVILHGLYAANGGPESLYLDSLRLPVKKLGLSLVYGVGAVHAYWGGLLQSPYWAFYALAAVGFFTSALRYRMNTSSNSSRSNNSRRHFHRH